jgi:hypothetical protein
MENLFIHNVNKYFYLKQSNFGGEIWDLWWYRWEIDALCKIYVQIIQMEREEKTNHLMGKERQIIHLERKDTVTKVVY